MDVRGSRSHRGLGLVAMWEGLVAPSTELTNVGDRLHARLLAALLLVIVVTGMVSGVVQLLVVPGFAPTFRTMCGALALITCAYVLSRTGHVRAAGVIASLSPLVACAIVAIVNPADRVWWAFAGLSVLLSSAFLGFGATVAVALANVAVIAALTMFLPALRSPERLVPALAFHVIFSPLMILAARHRGRLEAARAKALLGKHAAVADARRAETMARLTAGVAHDFNNVLTIVAAGACALRLRSGPCSEAADIEAASQRGAALVRQLLTFARSQTLAVSVLDVGAIVNGLEAVLRRLVGDDVALSFERASAAATVRAERSQIEQVVLNLVANARDATQPGGTVRVRVHARVATGGPSPGPYVAIEVADTGAGISEDVRRRIFEPFFTTKDGGKGTGLGLAIVDGIVAQAGGHIVIESEPGRGSTFRVHLPRIEAPSAAAEVEGDASP